jgi:hypothetical protein
MRRFRAGHQHLAEAVQECRTLVSRHLVLYSSGIGVDEFLVFFGAFIFSGFGNVERCVKVCVCVWIWDFLAHILFLCQRPEL